MQSPCSPRSRFPRLALQPLALAAALALGSLTMTASAQSAPSVTVSDGTLLSVSSQAEARRVPDIARLSTGVVTQAADANAAMRANSEQMSKVVAAIKAAGIATGTEAEASNSEFDGDAADAGDAPQADLADDEEHSDDGTAGIDTATVAHDEVPADADPQDSALPGDPEAAPGERAADVNDPEQDNAVETTTVPAQYADDAETAESEQEK